MATLKDIALLSGVATSTVSEVLNDKPRSLKMTKETKTKIFSAAKKLNYTPNITARGLKTGRSMQIGLFVTDFAGSILPYLIQGIENVLYANGYTATLYMYRSKNDIMDRINTIKQRHVDGILLFPRPEISPSIFHKVFADYPVVTLTRKIGDSNIPCVKVDAEEIEYLAAKYLLTNGHKKIAFRCSGSRTGSGCLKAIAEFGLSQNTVEFTTGPGSFEDGREFFRKIYPRQDITGVFAYNDTCAAGMIYEAAVNGIRIPERMSIIGCNNMPIASQIFPKITTVNQPKEEQGAEATKMLLSMIESGNECHDKILRPDLIIRDSTRAL